MTTGARAVATVVLAVATFVSGTARAQDYTEITPAPTASPVGLGPRVSAEPDVRFDAFVHRLLALPRLSFDDGARAATRVASGTYPASGGVTFAGAGFSLGATFSDHWLVPFFGADFSAAIGPSDRVLTSLDGSLADLRPWTARKLDVWLFGVGYRMKKRRWMFQAVFEPGVSAIWVNGAIATGRDAVDVRTSAVSFAARVDFEVCRRFDPTNRGCLFFAPSVYEFGLLNGGSVGVRWEFGP